MTSKIKVNILADGGDNAILTSNGSGTVTINNTALKNTPSFAATRNSSQTLSDDAITKIQYDVELLDSDAKYDTSNYRFTPGTAGKYLIIHQCYCAKTSDSTVNTVSSYIYKNGSSYGYNQINFAANPVRTCSVTRQVIIDMDADDYVEPYAYVDTTSGTIDLESTTAAPLSVFMGYKLIGV